MNKVEEIVSMLRSKKFRNLTNEKALQEEVRAFFIEKKIPFIKEEYIDENNIFDFRIQDTGIVIEVKIKGSKMALYNQIKRYCDLQVCEKIVILTSLSFAFPKSINNKDCYVVRLSNQWL